ncbi:uncharacterized protein RSE6_03144 [Rhynchosporium secalis]|uniref:Uncharacterized protein n=1 Tax=Rhynchosporium secalis TaxID=38038 RepID=A0A1E1M205_RHYSE|nr:uncharacterized protein RSE6_03144 [Rhynchosporium secalis]
MFTFRQHYLPAQLQLHHQYRAPRSASLILELSAIARSPGSRASFQSFALPPSPAPLPSHSSSPAQIELKVEFEKREPGVRYPLTACSNNFTDRRATMPAPRAHSWAEELRNQQNRRHSIIPPVPAIPAMYSNANLARPSPPAPLRSMDPRWGPRAHTPTTSHHYDNLGGGDDSASASSIDSDEGEGKGDLYHKALAVPRRVAPSRQNQPRRQIQATGRDTHSHEISPSLPLTHSAQPTGRNTPSLPLSQPAEFNGENSTSTTDTYDDDTEDLYSTSPVTNRRATPQTSVSEGIATSAVDTTDTNHSDPEGLYNASPVRKARVMQSSGFKSSRDLTHTPPDISRAQPQPYVPRDQREYMPVPRNMSESLPSTTKDFFGDHTNSDKNREADFNGSSATIGQVDRYFTGMSNSAVDEDSDGSDLTTERPKDPVGSLKEGNSNDKASKKLLFFSKTSHSSPKPANKPQVQPKKSLGHQGSSLFDLRKASAKNSSQYSLGRASSPLDSSPTKLRGFAYESMAPAVAPAIVVKSNKFRSDDRPSSRGPKASRSLFNLREKARTPAPAPAIISGPTNVKHVYGFGTTFEKATGRDTPVSRNGLNWSGTIPELDVSPPRRPRAPSAVHTSQRGTAASRARFSPTEPNFATDEGAGSEDNNSPATGGRSTLQRQEPGTSRSSSAVHFSEGVTTQIFAKSSTSAESRGLFTPIEPKSLRVDSVAFDILNPRRPPIKKGAAPTPSITKSSTSAKIGARDPKPSMAKSSTSGQVDGRTSAFGWSKRSTPAPKGGLNIGVPTGVVQMGGSGTVLASVMGQSTPNLVPPASASVNRARGASNIALCDLVNTYGNVSLGQDAAQQSTSSLYHPSEPARSSTPAPDRGRTPEPASRSRNPFMRAPPSTMAIGTPYGAVHTRGEGTAFEEVKVRSTPTASGTQGPTNRASPRRYQSMQDIRGGNTSSPTRIPSPVDESPQGRNFTPPLLPSQKKENIVPAKAHRLLGTISPARVQTKPSNLPVPKSRTFGKLSSLSSSFGRSVVNLGTRNQSTTSFKAASTTSLHADPTTSVSNSTATAVPVIHNDVTLIYDPPEGDNWAGMFGTLKDTFLNEMKDVTLADPIQMRRFQNRAESEKKKKKDKGRDDEDAGTVGIDNLLSEEDERFKRVFAVMEARAVTQRARESLWRFQERFANIHHFPYLLPASCKPEETGGFMARVREALGRKE